MSTLPGRDSWADAGLVPSSIGDLVRGEDEPEVEEPEEYLPPLPPVDPDAEADEADVIEQAKEVPADEREDYPE